MHSAESFSCRLSQEQEEDLLAGIRLENEELNRKSLKINKKTSTEINDNAPVQSSSEKRILHDTKTNKTPTTSSYSKQQQNSIVSSESDLVSSTNREDEENLSQSISTSSDRKEDDHSFSSSDKTATLCDDSDRSFSNTEASDSKSEQTIATSQELSEDNSFNNGVNLDADFDADDADDVRERRNPKTCVERETPQSIAENNRQKNFSNFQRNRHIRPQMQKSNHPYQGPNQMISDNFNPAFMSQFRAPRRLLAPQSDFLRGRSLIMRAPPPLLNRMPLMQPNRMSIPSHGIIPPRMQRAPFPAQPNMGFGNNSMPPQGNLYFFDDF